MPTFLLELSQAGRVLSEDDDSSLASPGVSAECCCLSGDGPSPTRPGPTLYLPNVGWATEFEHSGGLGVIPQRRPG